MASYSKPTDSSSSGSGTSSSSGSSSTTTPSSSSSSVEPKGGMRESMQDVKRDAQMIKEDVSALGHDAAAAGVQAYHQAADQVSEYARSFSDSVKQCHATARQNIADRPIATILIAAGVGMVLGRFMGRK